MDERSAKRARRILMISTVVSFMGALSALIHYGMIGTDANSLDGYGTTSIARNSPPAPALVTRIKPSADYLFTQSGKRARADSELAQLAEAEPSPQAAQIHFMAASITPVQMPYEPPMPKVSDYQDVNRGGKTDRLTLEMVVAKPELALEAEPMQEGTSAALFLMAPPLSATASIEAEKPKSDSKSTWADLVKLASVKGGDGESGEPNIFGNLTEKEFRAREFSCLATAIYFEARGEEIRGQIAVAQVIMTRVRSEFYPNTICGVVYQGQWNRNACQFSFACDGKPDIAKDRKQWKVALDVAKNVISGQVYLDEIGDATHYHATYVKPDWRKIVKRISRIGVHIFYKADFAPPLVANSDFSNL